MRGRGGSKGATRLIALVIAGATLGGCAFDPSAITLPGTGRGEAYRVHVEFANALNLPARAKVMANGVQVGDLAAVTVVDPTATVPGHVIADLDIDRAVELPARTTAQLRQNTLLGDVFIELTTPPDGFDNTLADGGGIPIAQTKPPVQVEDVMAALATFVQGGAVHQFQDLVNRMNAVLPQQPPDTARITQVIGADFEDVARHLDEVDRFLDGMEADTAMVLDRDRALRGLLSEQGATHVTSALKSLILVLGVAGVMGDLVHSFSWMTSLVTAGDAAAKALMPLMFTNRPLDLNAPSNLNRIVSLIRDRIIPFAEHGAKVNITSIDAGTGIPADEQTSRIIDTLRMIGAVR
ncbi:MlaD family protein [Nocardia abscessus]|uniref:MlaD family protein n=1 Tax=Nocardia abscessus TaxID=120957 RepID=UPI002457E537|nr:MlaD family protein [Nocardia abscessus]